MKNHKVLAVAVILLAVVSAGVLFAQMKEMPKPETKVTTTQKCENCPGGMGMSNMAPDMPGMPGMMMPDLAPDVQKKLIEQQMKFAKETSPLRADLEQKQLEMRLLWLDDEPNADKIVAKLGEIDKIEMQLKEKHVRHCLTVSGILPKEMRKNLLRGCFGGMGPGMGMGNGMGMMGMQGGKGMCQGMCGMGTGPGMMGGKGMGQGMMGGKPQIRIEKKIIKKGSGADDDKEEGDEEE